jgi:SsrA-binding protein
MLSCPLKYFVMTGLSRFFLPSWGEYTILGKSMVIFFVGSERRNGRSAMTGKTKTVATNRKARRDFHILESMEAGIELRGSEVKSLRQGRANLRDSYARVEGGQLFLYNMHISPYEQSGPYRPDPRRRRRLLMHRREIKRLVGKTAERGLTIIPLQIYFSGAIAKVELALGRGKRDYDRREDIYKRETDRAIQRAMKDRVLGRDRKSRK